MFQGYPRYIGEKIHSDGLRMFNLNHQHPPHHSGQSWISVVENKHNSKNQTSAKTDIDSDVWDKLFDDWLTFGDLRDLLFFLRQNSNPWGGNQWRNLRTEPKSNAISHFPWWFYFLEIDDGPQNATSKTLVCVMVYRSFSIKRKHIIYSSLDSWNMKKHGRRQLPLTCCENICTRTCFLSQLFVFDEPKYAQSSQIPEISICHWCFMPI